MSLDAVTYPRVGPWVSAAVSSLPFDGGAGGKGEPSDKGCIVLGTNLRFGKHLNGPP